MSCFLFFVQRETLKFNKGKHIVPKQIQHKFILLLKICKVTIWDCFNKREQVKRCKMARNRDNKTSNLSTMNNCPFRGQICAVDTLSFGFEKR